MLTQMGTHVNLQTRTCTLTHMLTPMHKVTSIDTHSHVGTYSCHTHTDMHAHAYASTPFHKHTYIPMQRRTNMHICSSTLPKQGRAVRVTSRR